jgi:hypothetical protein
VHLRAPSLDHGLVSGLWAVFFFLFMFFGSVAVDVDRAIALIYSAVAAAAIFFFIRFRGQEPLR